MRNIHSLSDDWKDPLARLRPSQPQDTRVHVVNVSDCLIKAEQRVAAQAHVHVHLNTCL